jgi:hypothetical protein
MQKIEAINPLTPPIFGATAATTEDTAAANAVGAIAAGASVGAGGR